MGEFVMPSLGADMEEGTLIEWLVKPGQLVHKGDPIAVVETDKADVEVECFEDGRIDTLLVEPATKVPVGAPLAVLVATGAETPAKPAKAETPPRPAKAEIPPKAVNAPAPTGRAEPVPLPRQHPASPLPRHRAKQRAGQRAGKRGERAYRRSSPLARRTAEELGIDLSELSGSGPGGAIRARDLVTPGTGKGSDRQAVPVVPVVPAGKAPKSADRQAAARRATADLMSRSKREIPHYYLSTTVDMSRALQWVSEANAQRSVADRLVPAALILRAIAVAAHRSPDLNGWYVEETYQPADAVHLGVAVALRPAGLVTPAILAASDKTVGEIMAALADLVTRARSGRLRHSELTSATITVTNLGDLGVESVYGVIYPPQVALVGCGRIVERPFAAAGMVGVRPELTVTLSADHRVSDGRTGGRFLTLLDQLLQMPEEL